MSLSKIFVNNTQVVDVDNVPTSNSDNLVKSGGVEQELKNIDLGTLVDNGFINLSNGTFGEYDGYKRTSFLLISSIKTVIMRTGVNSTNVAAMAFYASDDTSTYIYGINSLDYAIGSSIEIDIPSGANYCVLCWRVQYQNYVFLKIKNVPDTIQNISKFIKVIPDLQEQSLEIENLKRNIGITLTENRSGVNYQKVFVPQGADCKITLISGGTVTIYTKKTLSDNYHQQGTLHKDGETLTLDTSNEINYICVYTGGRTSVVKLYSTNEIENNTINNTKKIDDVVYKTNTLATIISDISIPFELIDNGGYINFNNGNFTEANSYKSTDYIYCKSLNNISFLLAYKDSAGIAFYNKNQEYISGISKTSEENLGDIVKKSIPSAAYYFRICFQTIFCQIFFICSSFYPSETSIKQYDETQRTYNIGELQEGYINFVNGNFIEASSYSSTDFIKLIGKKIKYSIYFKDSAGIAFYDKNESYVTGYNNPSGTDAYGTIVEITIPNNAVYVRYCGIKQYVSYFILQCSDESSFIDFLTRFESEISPSGVNPCFYKDSCGCRTFKKILCIGDSLTSGTFEYRDGDTKNTYFEDAALGYPTFLKCLTGRDTTNKGSGGQTTKSWWLMHENDDLSGHDACIIALGRNDYSTGREATQEERYEYMGYIINKVRTENPQIKVFVATMLNYYTGSDADAVNEDMRGIAETNNCYLVDISAYGKLTMSNNAFSHLTAVGYETVANYYFNYISYIMAQNPTDFKNIQFIGTNHYW